MARSKSGMYSLGPLEKEVMENIWQRKSGATVKEILGDINSHKMVPYAYTTILTICQNLEKKGFLVSKKEGKLKRYFPTVMREEFYRRRLRHFLGNFVKEHPDVAASFFAEAMDLTPEEAYEILKKLES
ncbi:MAG: BlaI/MecI/CopY family transcriptional regulator [Thermotogae bacterium]|nr:BlaI/MecI/CopY family transcriptional regulator [Thermotogota bacterium]